MYTRALLFTFVTTFFIFTSNARTLLVEQISDNLKALTLQEKVTTPELKKSFIEISDNGRYNDLMILQLFTEVMIPDEEILNWIELQQEDGSWTDINYEDNLRSRWAPAYHSTRIQAMVKVYYNPQSKLYNSSKLAENIHRAMDFWFKTEPRCLNWWYNQIGVPKMFAPAFLLFWNEMSESEKEGAIKVFDNAKFGMTGQNRVWLAGIVLVKAILTEDEALLREARDIIASEIIISTDEGLQPDYSFHQHGAMKQFGNYGLAYINSMVYWARVFAGTELKFDEQQIDILHDYMYEGTMRCVWRGYFDPSASERQVFHNSQKGKGFALGVTAINLAVADPKNKDLYIGFAEANMVNPESRQELLADDRYFYRSEYGVHRTPDWFGSVRMHSNRTAGYEIINGENLKGFFSADGVTITMVDGGEYDNIYPIWDWRYLPGTTVTSLSELDRENPETAKIRVSANKEDMNSSSFVGGVSNKNNSCMVMELDRDSLFAKKAYFFINDALVCLGNSINPLRKGAKVHTTIEQSLLNGKVSQGKSKTGEWIHHDKKGYVVFNETPTSLIVTEEKKSGDWRDIAAIYREGTMAEGEVFTAYINHGTDAKNDRYAYAILPVKNAKETEAYAEKPDIRIISNTPKCQAVVSTDGLQLMAVFYEAGKIEFPNNWKFEVKQSCIMMIRFSEKDGSIQSYSFSSPDRSHDAIEFKYTAKQHPSQSVGKIVQLDNSIEKAGSTVSFN